MNFSLELHNDKKTNIMNLKILIYISETTTLPPGLNYVSHQF